MAVPGIGPLARVQQHRGRHAVQAQRAQLPDRVLPRAERAEIAFRTETFVEVVLRDAEDAGVVEEPQSPFSFGRVLRIDPCSAEV